MTIETTLHGRRVAWVTGAGKGIGRAVALKLAEDGWQVAASARTAGDLRSLVADSVTGRIHGFPLDVTRAEDVAGVVGEIERDLGPIGLALLNAGTHIPTPADSFRLEDFRHLVETNLMGTAACLSVLMPRCIARRSGHIAVVASLAGYRGLPGAAAYGATKAGLINMCEALKPELDRHGVRLTLVNPGFVRTPLTARNRFPMPFLINADEAAASIVRGLGWHRFEIAFPWRLAWIMTLLRLIPNGLLFRITRRMVQT